jgi:hypothetical protein
VLCHRRLLPSSCAYWVACCMCAGPDNVCLSTTQQWACVHLCCAILGMTGYYNACIAISCSAAAGYVLRLTKKGCYSGCFGLLCHLHIWPSDPRVAAPLRHRFPQVCAHSSVRLPVTCIALNAAACCCYVLKPRTVSWCWCGWRTCLCMQLC